MDEDKINEIDLPPESRITLSVPINTGKQIQIDILVNGKLYGTLSIPEGITGEFDCGAIEYSETTKKLTWKAKFPFKFTSFDINTGFFNAHFTRDKN